MDKFDWDGLMEISQLLRNSIAQLEREKASLEEANKQLSQENEALKASLRGPDKEASGEA